MTTAKVQPALASLQPYCDRLKKNGEQIIRSAVQIKFTGKMTFEYDRLNESANQIRLITLYPAAYDADIRLSLRTVTLSHPKVIQRKRLTTNELQKTLPPGWKVEETAQYKYRYIFEDADENTSWTHPDPKCDPAAWQDLEELPPTGFEPAFEALSYTWGSQQDLVTAEIISHYGGGGGHTVFTRRNLAAALRSLRYPDKVRTLWVDAICINQSNPEERSSQVKHMSQIYKLAQRVIIWLGPSNSSTATAVHTLRYLGSQLEVSRRGSCYRAPNSEQPEWFRATEDLHYDDAKWQAISDLLQLSWFERLWVWQEIQLANSCAIVVCGSYHLDWHCLRKALICLYAKRFLSYPGLCQRLKVVKPLMYERHGCPVNLLLRNSQQRLCSEPKDHVYGMLSICGPGLANEMVPNYNPLVPYFDIYKDFCLKYMDQVRRLDLLSHCEQVSKKHSGPSWIPDWSVKRKTSSLYAYSFASGISASVKEYISPDVLRVKGIKAAVLSDVSKDAPENDIGIMRSMKDREPSDLFTGNYPTGESLFSAYCFTLRAGFLAERWPIDARPSLEEWKAQYLTTTSNFSQNSPSSHNNINNVDRAWRLKLVKGRPIIRTANGYIGLGPPGARPGDIVTILLGCKSAMILRPISQGSQSIFSVVGECYIHGLDDAVTLLGTLPSNFRSQLGVVQDGHTAVYAFKNLENKEAIKEDPRLPPLPAVWRQMDRGKTYDDPVLAQYFENEETGEVINFDPRLSEDALESRGIQLQSFDLR